MENVILKEGSHIVIAQYEPKIFPLSGFKNSLLSITGINKPLRRISRIKETEPSKVESAIVVSVSANKNKTSPQQIVIQLLAKNKPVGDYIDLVYAGEGKWHYLFPDPLSDVRSYNERQVYCRIKLTKK